jgi:hypothetical protein
VNGCVSENEIDAALPLTTADLVRAAADAGFAVNEQKIRRLARSGIFLRGRRGPGRGLTQATCSNRYPIGADQLLIEVCGIMQHVHGLRSVGWELFWRRLFVADKYWRTPLKQVALNLDRHLLLLSRRGFRSNEGVASDELMAAIDKLKTAEIDDPMLRQVRNRLRDSERFQTFMVMMLEAALGAFESLVRIVTNDADAADNEQILRRGLGFHRAHKDRTPDGAVLLPKEVEADLPIASLSRSLRGKSIQAALRHATDRQICKARDELRTLLNLLSNVGAHLETIHGKDAFGLGSIQTVSRSRHGRIQSLLLLWIACGEESELRSNARQFLMSISDCAHHNGDRGIVLIP